MVSSSASFSAAYNVREQATTMTSLSGTNSTGMVYSGPNQFERVTAGGTTYLNNALGVGAETTSTATTRFRRDADGGLHSERLPGTNAIHYYVFDGLGSVTGLSDAAGTTPLPTTYSYDPYGLTTTSGAANVNPWKYASTYADATGFYKMGARYYSPNLMRWSQRDPLEQLTDPVQANRYGYAGLNPINGVDPTGTHLIGDAWDDLRGASEDAAEWVNDRVNTAKRFIRSAPGRCLTYGAIGAGIGWQGSGVMGADLRVRAGVTLAGAGVGCLAGLSRRI